jgi:uncharacterized RDD family membrane protein YckC
MAKDYEQDLHREGLQTASIKKRAMAFVIDDLLISLIAIGIFGTTISSLEDTEQIILALNSFVMEILFIKLLYHTFFMWYYGATIGKRFMKLYVINIDTFSRPTLLECFVRAILRIIGEMLMYISFLFAFKDDLRQTLHDKFARTFIIDATL